MNLPVPRAAAVRRTLPKHLRSLEAQSIEIMREVIAEFKKPVMLYSIGKDSSVMLHLATKAFHPARLPFPLLHVDTTWKFRDMIAFRDETVRRLGADLLVYINADGLARGISPVTSGCSVHTRVMKTEALLIQLRIDNPCCTALVFRKILRGIDEVQRFELINFGRGAGE
jgi:sulfate adenylyltransferase subunit 2